MNGTSIPSSLLLPPPSEVPFSPPWTAVIANILWFVSLGLSFACAVTATLVQQWARNYIHAIERRPSAERRARMRMYLFEGVERFSMSQIVDAVPAILHLALFSFLLGLVFFIQLINWPVAGVAIAIFFTSVASYLYATFLPFVAFDSPIQTPLTNVIWHPALANKVYSICASVLMTRVVAGLIVDHVVHHQGQYFKPLKRTPAIVWTTVDLLGRHVHSRLSATFSFHTLLPVHRVTPNDSEYALGHALRSAWLNLHNHWSCDSFGPNLEAARSLTAHKTNTLVFQEREQRAFTWLVECLDDDREMIPFLEAIPSFVKRASRDHDTQKTFSYIFRNPRFSLYTRLPRLLTRHIYNTRVRAAFADFHQCVQKEDWIHIFRCKLTTPRDMWPHPRIWSYITGSSPPEIRIQMNSIQSTIDVGWLSAGRTWDSISYDFGNTVPNVRVTYLFNPLLLQLLKQLGIAKNVPLYLQPALSFTKVFLDALAYMTPQNDYNAQLFLREHLPFSTSWFSGSAASDRQQSYLAILMTIVTAIEMKYESETQIPVPILKALRPLLVRLQAASDPDALVHVDQLLRRKWFQSRTLAGSFASIIQAHMSKRDHLGQRILSSQVTMMYTIAMLDRATDYAAATKAVESLNLRQSHTDVQRYFVEHVAMFSPAEECSYMRSGSPAFDPDAGIKEVFFFESTFEVFITLHDLTALRAAFDLVNDFLLPDHYPYNQHALECRSYLQDIIRRRVLLDSVYDHTMVVAC